MAINILLQWSTQVCMRIENLRMHPLYTVPRRILHYAIHTSVYNITCSTVQLLYNTGISYILLYAYV